MEIDSSLKKNATADDIGFINKLIRIKSNVTIDWNIEESLRAKMKVIVKRLLRKYGYLPDMKALATEMVLDQANLFSDFQVNN